MSIAITRKEIRSFLENDLISELMISPEISRDRMRFHWQNVFKKSCITYTQQAARNREFAEFLQELQEVCGEDIFNIKSFAATRDGLMYRTCYFDIDPADIEAWEAFLDAIYKEELSHE